MGVEVVVRLLKKNQSDNFPVAPFANMNEL